jgi:BirA family biotin operon repressor/biotin-[acetyl-CoA-carboxylase] ligase
MTVILRPPFVFSPLDALPLIGALAIARTLNSNLNLTSKVRWPNDVVIEHRKLAGILTETQFSGNRFEYALLGIGINANFPSFRLGELAPTCRTLLEVLGSAVDREELISSLLLELERLYQQASNKRESELMDLLWDLDCSRRAHVRIKIGNQELSGVFEGYETFTKVRFRTSQGSHLSLDTSSVENVMYVDL